MKPEIVHTSDKLTNRTNIENNYNKMIPKYIFVYGISEQWNYSNYSIHFEDTDNGYLFGHL